VDVTDAAGAQREGEGLLAVTRGVVQLWLRETSVDERPVAGRVGWALAERALPKHS
jgi:hypothetical protein